VQLSMEILDQLPQITATATPVVGFHSTTSLDTETASNLWRIGYSTLQQVVTLLSLLWPWYQPTASCAALRWGLTTCDSVWFQPLSVYLLLSASALVIIWYLQTHKRFVAPTESIVPTHKTSDPVSTRNAERWKWLREA
jgi:hypothetical protein